MYICPHLIKDANLDNNVISLLIVFLQINGCFNFHYFQQILNTLHNLPEEIGYEVAKPFETQINGTIQPEMVVVLTVKFHKSDIIPHIVFFAISQLLHGCKEVPVSFSITEAELFDGIFE